MIFFSTHTKNGHFITVSNNVLETLGYTPSELVGKNVYDYFHTEDLKRIVGSHVNVRKSIQKVNYRFRSKSGKFTWLKVYSYEDENTIFCMTFKLCIFDIIKFQISNWIDQVIQKIKIRL